MKKVTKKAFGILALVVLSVPAQAGWLSNLGQRIVNGAANTVQTNISGKVNKAVNDVMDGKVGNQKNNSNTDYNKNTSVRTSQKNLGTPSKAEAEVMLEDQIDSSGMLSLEYVKKRALPVKGIYQEVDFGTYKFRGERLHGERLYSGEQFKELNFYLLPGTYLVCFTPRSYEHNVSVGGKHEREGIQEGYGINILKYIENNGFLEMNAKKGSTVYTIQVSKNGGNFHMFMFNDQSKSGALEFVIYKIPGPNLEIIK